MNSWGNGLLMRHHVLNARIQLTDDETLRAGVSTLYRPNSITGSGPVSVPFPQTYDAPVSGAELVAREAILLGHTFLRPSEQIPGQVIVTEWDGTMIDFLSDLHDRGTWIPPASSSPPSTQFTHGPLSG